jgi:hypothetical protein
VVAYNLLVFQWPLHTVLRDDPRNEGVSAIAHAEWWFLNPGFLERA